MMHWHSKADSKRRPKQLELFDDLDAMKAGKSVFVTGNTTRVHWPLYEVLHALESGDGWFHKIQPYRPSHAVRRKDGDHA